MPDKDKNKGSQFNQVDGTNAGFNEYGEIVRPDAQQPGIDTAQTAQQEAAVRANKEAVDEEELDAKIGDAYKKSENSVPVNEDLKKKLVEDAKQFDEKAPEVDKAEVVKDGLLTDKGAQIPEDMRNPSAEMTPEDKLKITYMGINGPPESPKDLSAQEQDDLDSAMAALEADDGSDLMSENAQGEQSQGAVVDSDTMLKTGEGQVVDTQVTDEQEYTNGLAKVIGGLGGVFGNNAIGSTLTSIADKIEEKFGAESKIGTTENIREAQAQTIIDHAKSGLNDTEMSDEVRSVSSVPDEDFVKDLESFNADAAAQGAQADSNSTVGKVCNKIEECAISNPRDTGKALEMFGETAKSKINNVYPLGSEENTKAHQALDNTMNTFADTYYGTLYDSQKEGRSISDEHVEQIDSYNIAKDKKYSDYTAEGYKPYDPKNDFVPKHDGEIVDARNNTEDLVDKVPEETLKSSPRNLRDVLYGSAKGVAPGALKGAMAFAPFGPAASQMGAVYEAAKEGKAADDDAVFFGDARYPDKSTFHMQSAGRMDVATDEMRQRGKDANPDVDYMTDMCEDSVQRLRKGYAREVKQGDITPNDCKNHAVDNYKQMLTGLQAYNNSAADEIEAIYGGNNERGKMYSTIGLAKTMRSGVGTVFEAMKEDQQQLGLMTDDQIKEIDEMTKDMTGVEVKFSDYLKSDVPLDLKTGLPKAQEKAKADKSMDEMIAGDDLDDPEMEVYGGHDFSSGSHDHKTADAGTFGHDSVFVNEEPVAEAVQTEPETGSKTLSRDQRMQMAEDASRDVYENAEKEAQKEDDPYAALMGKF